MKKKRKNNKYIKNILKDLDNESKFSIYEVVIIVFISVCFGIIIGYILTYTNSSMYAIRNDSNLSDIVTTYKEINDNYYKKVDKKKISEAAVSAMMKSLDDPNTSYISDDFNDSFNETMNG